MEEIEKNDFNLNISRYVSTTLPEKIIDLKEVNDKLGEIEERIKESSEKHNEFFEGIGIGRDMSIIVAYP